MRQFLPSLLTTITFQHAPAGQAVADAIKFLTLINGQRTPDMKEAPLGIVSGPWRRSVVGTNQVAERRAYTLCALERIQDSLRRRDLFVEKSERWGDPRTKLLSKDAWQSVRPRVCQIPGRRTSAKEELSWFGQQLDEAYRRTLANLPSNPFVRIEQEKGRDRIVLTPLDKLEEPASLVCLQERLASMLPKVELPEMLLEIHNRTGFAQMFTHINESEARVADLAISVCAVLIAEACNIGLEPLIQEDQPALTRNRLSWVQQNYFRAETLIQANVRLVNEQNKIPLAMNREAAKSLLPMGCVSSFQCAQSMPGLFFAERQKGIPINSIGPYRQVWERPSRFPQDSSPELRKRSVNGEVDAEWNCRDILLKVGKQQVGMSVDLAADGLGGPRGWPASPARRRARCRHRRRATPARRRSP